MHNLRLKIRSEPIQDGFPPSSWGAAIPNSLAISFSGEIMMYFRERDVITMEIPPKMGKSLRFLSDFIPECAFRHPNLK